MCVHREREREMVCLRLVAFFMALWEEQVCVHVCVVSRTPANVRSDKHTPGGRPRESARRALKRRFVAPLILTALLSAFEICIAEEHSFLLKRHGGENASV